MATRGDRSAPAAIQQQRIRRVERGALPEPQLIGLHPYDAHLRKGCLDSPAAPRAPPGPPGEAGKAPQKPAARLSNPIPGRLASQAWG